MSTGQKCTRSGIYQGVCSHRPQIALSNGDTFPPCSPGRHAVTWRLIQPTR